LPSSFDAIQLNHDDECLSAMQQLMSERCTRNGDARYAVKFLLLADATRAERVQARLDLAIEVNFLHALSHPHIIKMRGLFKSETPFHPDYFFVMDRLFGTLEDKTKEWIAAKREYKSRRPVWPLHRFNVHSSANEGINNLFIERLLVAHDVASVLGYMHANEVIYR
jgi:serine/threonine protein kinase